MDLGNGCEILGTVEHGQARTHAYTKLPRESHFLFACGVLETPKILGLEHKSKDKLQRVWNRGNSARAMRVGCCARYAPGQFFKEHHDGRFRWEQSICSQWKYMKIAKGVEWCWAHRLLNAEARSLCSSTWMTFRPVLDGSRAPGIAAKSSAWWIPMFWPHHRSCFGRPHGFLMNDSLMMTVCRCFENVWNIFLRLIYFIIFLYCNWAKFVSMTQAWRRWWDIFQGAQHEGHWQHPFSRGLSRAVFCVSWTSELDCQCARLQF